MPSRRAIRNRRPRRPLVLIACVTSTALAVTGAVLAGGSPAGPAHRTPAQAADQVQAVDVPADAPAPGTADPLTPVPPPAATFTPGNPDGTAPVPAQAQLVDTSNPDRVVGDGTPAGCTSQAVVEAVAAGGVITFDCGPAPVTIGLDSTAKVRNASARVVLDGGGLVTLSGRGERRIIYQNTCDQAQGWTTSHCDDQDHPRLTLQNLTFADGSSTGESTDGGGGGAVFVRGGSLTVLNSVFVRNRCDRNGPDVGGAAIRVLDQYRDQPVHVVASTFGGAPGQGGSCSDGGALSSIGVSWQVLNSVLTHNEAIGHGANPAQAGTPGGGSGGAIYNDGNTFTTRVAGSVVTDNDAREGGGAVFFVSNDRTGTLSVEDSTLERNRSGEFETQPGIFYLGATAAPGTAGSTIR